MTQTQSGRSLPRSLEPFAQPVHVDFDGEEEDMGDIPAIELGLRKNQESHLIPRSELEERVMHNRAGLTRVEEEEQTQRERR